jgi:tetratricopeptide (TPR) repeat protein
MQLADAFVFHQTAGDLRERTMLLMCLNRCEYEMGDYDTAIESTMRSRYEAQIIGELYNETVALMRVAKALIARGLYQEAENLLLGVWEKQKNLEAMYAKAEMLWMLGRVQMFLQNYEAAAYNLDNALEIIRTVGDCDDEFPILTDQAHPANYRINFPTQFSYQVRKSLPLTAANMLLVKGFQIPTI